MLFRSEIFKEYKSKLMPSDRCGVHVHINMQQMTKKQVLNFAILYYILEDVLINYCGNDREGNLFCLRAKDAEFIIKMLQVFAQRINSAGHFGRLIYPEYKYSALNFSALPKFGSLEFRSLKTPANVTKIEEWIKILLCVKDASLTFDNPPDICEVFSSKGCSNI